MAYNPPITATPEARTQARNIFKILRNCYFKAELYIQIVKYFQSCKKKKFSNTLWENILFQLVWGKKTRRQNVIGEIGESAKEIGKTFPYHDVKRSLHNDTY